jgi:hypothetical protein
MFLLPESESYYENLAHFLKHGFPRLVVVKELVKWSGLNADDVLMALQYGKDPRVRVTGLGPLRNKAFVEFGFTPNNGTHIQISRAMIWILEGIPHALLFGKERTSSHPLAVAGRELLRTIETTLLHELVHWGNVQTRTLWIDKTTNRRVPKHEQFNLDDGIEAGFAFEDEAGLKTTVPVHFMKPQPLELSPIFMPRKPPPL